MGFKKVLGHLSFNQQEKEINAILREIHRRTESVSETNNITHYTPNSALWTPVRDVIRGTAFLGWTLAHVTLIAPPKSYYAV